VPAARHALLFLHKITATEETTVSDLTKDDTMNKQHWAIRLRLRLLCNSPSKWNAWVRDATAWLERKF